MFQEDDFYVHLDSTSNKNFFKEGKPKIGNFITRLPEKYHLNGDWEVALSKIQYSKTWLNIQEDQNLYLDTNSRIYRLDEKLPAGSYPNIEGIVIVLNEIYARYVHQFTSEFSLPPFLEYIPHINKVRVIFGIGKEYKGFVNDNKYLYPVMSEYLAQYLGLIDDDLYQMPRFEGFEILYASDYYKTEYNVNKKQKLMVKYPIIVTPFDIPKILENLLKPEGNPNSIMNDEMVNINSENSGAEPIAEKTDEIETENKTFKLPIYVNDQSSENTSQIYQTAYAYGYKQVQVNGFLKNLNIYCDVIKPVVIGGIAAPLLRTIPLYSGDLFGDHIEYEPNTREYIPVLYKEFAHIEVDLRNDQNETILFKNGKVHITLHFRRNRN